MVTQQAVDAIRALDESDLTHSHWHFHWEEEGSDWFVETVKNDRGEEWPVKQLVVESDGVIHRYWWSHMEDAGGGLGDQALDPLFPGIEAIPASAFFEHWDKVT